MIGVGILDFSIIAYFWKILNSVRNLWQQKQPLDMIEFWRRTHYHLIPTVLLDFLLVFDILDNIFAISYVLLQLLKSTFDKKEKRKATKSNFDIWVNWFDKKQWKHHKCWFWTMNTSKILKNVQKSCISNFISYKFIEL